jgi:uncharacterized protein
MKLKVFDIPEDGIEFRASADDKRDVWFRSLVEDAFREDFPKGAKAELDLYILRTSDNVQISGTARIALKPSCARCMEAFDKKLQVPLHVNLAPHKDMNFEEDEEAEGGIDKEDVAFSFYKGEEIDLDAILREILLLEIPLRYLCEESCKGLCAQCGHNLNLGGCKCAKKAADPRLAYQRFLQVLIVFVALEPREKAVRARHDEEREESGNGHAADDDQGHRNTGLGARSQA